MVDFITGLLIALREMFKSKKTINYPFEKEKLVQDLEESMHSDDIQMVRKDV